MALTLKFDTFRINPESNTATCTCFWDTSADIPLGDASANSLFFDEFDSAGQSGKNWTVKERSINKNSIIPEVELSMESSTDNFSSYSVVTVTPKTYARRAELKDVLKNEDGRGENKIAVYNTYKGIIKDWDTDTDWTNDPEIKTPGTKGLKQCTEWSFTSYNSSSQMKLWTGSNGVTSSIPFDVRKLSPLANTPGIVAKQAWLLITGEEKYDYFKNYSTKMYRVDAVMWVLLDGSEWEA